MKYKPIIEIKINKKSYIIAIKKVESRSNHFTDWFCAYVILKGKKIIDSDVLSYCTYRDGNIFGIDTAHFWNEKQTEEEKFEDAIKQITCLIKSYNRIRK